MSDSVNEVRLTKARSTAQKERIVARSTASCRCNGSGVRELI